MPRCKQVYKITYPNGKIYVGLDVTGNLAYMGSPTVTDAMAAELAQWRTDLAVRKEILWECDDATDADARSKEREWIIRARANNPDIGYNLTPRYRPDQR